MSLTLGGGKDEGRAGADVGDRLDLPLSWHALQYMRAAVGELDPGTVLCREGRLGREFFVIVDDTVEVTKGGERLATRGSGEFFGEIALLTTTTRTASVTAKTPLRCFILTRGDFRIVLDENPTVERKVMQALAERLHSYTGDDAL